MAPAAPRAKESKLNWAQLVIYIAVTIISFTGFAVWNVAQHPTRDEMQKADDQLEARIIEQLKPINTKLDILITKAIPERNGR